MPIPWGGDRPPFGFGPGDDQPWIPQPDDWAPHRRGPDRGPGSTLEFYRAALAARRSTRAGQVVEVTLVQATGDVLSLTAATCGRAQLRHAESRCPRAGSLLHSSGPVDDGLLPPDTAAWLS